MLLQNVHPKWELSISENIYQLYVSRITQTNARGFHQY